MGKLTFKMCFLFFIGVAQAVADDQLNENLFAAIRENNLQGVASLVSQGADVNAKNKLGFTPLMFSSDAEIAAYLIKKGAVIDAETANGLNALLMNTTYGTKPMVAVLVEAGADINRVGQFGMTPIMRACSFSKFDSVVYLAAKGANVNYEQKDGNTALMMCVVSASTIMKVRRNEQGVVEKDDLYGAKMSAALESIRSLVEHGAKLDARQVNLLDGSKVATPLGVAIRLNRQEVIECLRKLNAPEN